MSDMYCWLGDIPSLMSSDDDDAEEIRHSIVYDKHKSGIINDVNFDRYVTKYNKSHKIIQFDTLHEYTCVVMMLNVSEHVKSNMIKHEHKHAKVADKYNVPYTYNLNFTQINGELCINPFLSIFYPEDIEYSTYCKIKYEILNGPDTLSKLDTTMLEYLDNRRNKNER